MSVTTAMCLSYKQECLDGIHVAADVYKIALIKNGATGTYDKTLTNTGTPGTGAPGLSNLGTDEIGATGTYASGGGILANRLSGLTGDVAYVTWDDMVFASATISSIGAIIYNASKGNRAVMTISFADTVVLPAASTNANFTIKIPSSGIGQIRLS